MASRFAGSMTDAVTVSAFAFGICIPRRDFDDPGSSRRARIDLVAKCVRRANPTRSASLINFFFMG